MITAGVDVGAETVKVAIMNQNQVLGWSIVRAGLDRKASAEEALELAIKEAGIPRGDIKRTVATGTGRREVPYADESIVEIIADAKGVAFLLPSARTVIDVGAEEARGIRLNSLGKVQDFAKNDKCAAGVGAFVASMARALEITVEDMGPISLKSQQEIPMNVTCVVFAESEVVSLIHSQVPKEDIARAIHDAISTRTISMVKRVGTEKDIAFIGGVAHNIGVIDSLQNLLGTDVLIPENPQIVGAIGAALIAREQGDK